MPLTCLGFGSCIGSHHLPVCVTIDLFICLVMTAAIKVAPETISDGLESETGLNSPRWIESETSRGAWQSEFHLQSSLNCEEPENVALIERHVGVKVPQLLLETKCRLADLKKREEEQQSKRLEFVDNSVGIFSGYDYRGLAELTGDEKDQNEKQQGKGFGRQENSSGRSETTEITDQSGKRRKLKRDLRNEAEQSNLTYHGEWVLKTLLLAIGFKNCLPIETRLLYFFIFLSGLMTAGSCSSVPTSVVNATAGQRVILEGTGNDEYVPIWDWQFVSAENYSRPHTLCGSEKKLSANYSIDECSLKWILIHSAANRHAGMYILTRFYPENGTQTMLRRQLIVQVSVIISDSNQGTEISTAVVASITVLVATVLVAIVSIIVWKKRCCSTKTKNYSPANQDLPPHEVSVRQSNETVEFI